jgi:hypothetical protein
MLRLRKVDSTQQHRKLLLTEHDFALRATRFRPVKSAFLKFFRAHPQAGRIPEKNLQTIALRVRKEKQVAAQGIAQQLIAHQTIQAVEPLAHVGCARRKINPRRRAHAEHRLQPLKHSHQLSQRRSIEAATDFYSATVGQ